MGAQNDTWVGVFKLKWIFIKDIPNSCVRHITVSNDGVMPVTASRDTQELLTESGIKMLRMFHSFKHSSSILDLFPYYDHLELDRLTHRQKHRGHSRRHSRRSYRTNRKMVSNSNHHMKM